MIKWCPSKDIQKKIVTCIIGQKQIALIETLTQKTFIIAFSPNYGKVITYSWFGEEYLIVGFQNGIVTLISVKPDSMGQEITSINVGPSGPIDALSISLEQEKIAVA